LPVIQIVYETLKDIQEQKGMPKTDQNAKKSSIAIGFRMSAYDRTPSIGLLSLFNLN
jgi:hypothetical protein